MRLYLKYIKMIIKAQMQYKVSFFLMLAGQFLLSFSIFLSIYFLFDRFNEVEGFAFNEVLICFAVVILAFSLAEMIFRGFDSFAGTISSGNFDRIMVRPRNEMFQVLASKMELSRLGRFIQAFLILAYALPNSLVAWTAFKILILILMIFGGMFLFAGLFIIYAAICFFTIEGLEFMNIFTDGGRELGKYPLVIYGKGILKFFTFIIPLALVQYYPLLYLLGRSDNLLYAFLPLAGILFLIPSYVIWKFGVRHYKSTGN